MENKQAMNAAEPQGNFIVKSSDNDRQYISHSDILNRRMKNRERQRRYRAKKRLEADTKKASNEYPSAVQQMLPQQERTNNSGITCVPSGRNWKHDARRAQLCNTVDEKLATAATTLKNRAERSSMAHEMGTIPIGGIQSNIGNSSLPSYEAHKSKLPRRNWKAEARNMKA